MTTRNTLKRSMFRERTSTGCRIKNFFSSRKQKSKIKKPAGENNLNFLEAYNSNKFDIPLLIEEFNRAGIAFNVANRKLIDVQNIFHKKEERTLSAAYKFYCEKNHDSAHSAAADTRATFEILLAQLQRYE